MVSKFLNVDTDVTLSGNSDNSVASQKAVKTYIDRKVAGISGGGGGDSMQYLFGDGNDGNVTYEANTALNKSWYRYNNMTLSAGVTLTSSLHVPIVMSVQDTLTLNGTINFNNAGGTTTNGYPDSFGANLEGIKGSSMMTADAPTITTQDDNGSYSSNPFVVSGNGKGSIIVQATSVTKTTNQYSARYWVRHITNTILASSACGAANADANAMLRHLLAGTLFHSPVAGQGPSGGGGLIIYANNIIITDSFVYTATGTAGGCLAIGYKSGTIGAYSVNVGNGFSVIGQLL